MPFDALVVERFWKIKGRDGPFSLINMISFAYHPLNYNLNVKNVYENMQSVLYKVSFVEDESIFRQFCRRRQNSRT